MGKKDYIIIFVIVILSACSDDAQRNEWYFNTIQINKIWELVPTKGETQTIAFIDTGISKDVEKSMQLEL
jgi:hypothetical protein